MRACNERCRTKWRRSRFAVHFSSATDVWSTPRELFALLDEEFHFTLDVCALPENAKCAVYFTPDDDGLRQEWRGVIWMNPPYGRGIDRWIKKAWDAAVRGATVVCLLPARTDTRWWHQWVMQASEVRFLKGRLRFGNARHSAPFPSCLAIFRPTHHGLLRGNSL
jgi:phage N-6-adenine-methyltransferase